VKTRRIVLVQPPKPAFGSGAEGNWEMTRPFALHYLAAALRTKPHCEVQIVDFERRALAGLAEKEALPEGPAALYGVTATTFTRFEAIRLARQIRDRDPGAAVVFGGVHFSHCAEETLRAVPEIDAVVRGEGELALPAMVDTLDRREEWKGLPGVSSRDGAMVVHGPDQSDWTDLDLLPPFEGFALEDYPESLMGHTKKIQAVSVMTSRGCPYRCIFCSKSFTRYRVRNPRLVVDEIVAFRDRLGVKAVNFLDLTFTARPAHVRTLCEELVQRHVGISWWCESRANIHLDLLENMRRAGCVSIALGVESGSPRVLSSIQKDITLEQVKDFCRRAISVGIAVTAYFMYSHPGELPADVHLSLDFLERLQDLGVTVGGFQPAMVFPGSGLEPIARMNGSLPPGFSWTEPYDSELNHLLGQLPSIPIFLDRLRPEELIRFQEEYRSRTGTRNAVKAARGLTWRELAGKATRAVLEGRPTARLLWSPRFYRMWIREQRGKSRGGSER
jgi:hypothetical protein